MDERHLGRERKLHHLSYLVGHQRLVLCKGKLREVRALKSAMVPVVNTVTNKVSRLLGKDETVRWMNMAIYQGQPSKKSLNTVVSTTGIQESWCTSRTDWCVLGYGGFCKPFVS